jgi:hypothetical protein
MSREKANDFGPAPPGHCYAPDAIADAAVPAGCVRCERCGGTGAFVTAMYNGHPVGPGGICYRCEGKGYQTPKDVRRNYAYDIHRPVHY